MCITGSLGFLHGPGSCIGNSGQEMKTGKTWLDQSRICIIWKRVWMICWMHMSGDEGVTLA